MESPHEDKNKCVYGFVILVKVKFHENVFTNLNWHLKLLSLFKKLINSPYALN